MGHLFQSSNDWNGDDVGFYVNLPYCVVCADSYDNGYIFEL